MVTLSEEQYYRLYENLNKEEQRKVLQCIGADIGAFVGKFNICNIVYKKLIALKIEATICEKESLKKYIDMLLKLRGDTKMSELILKGTQKFMEIEIPVIYGGFGEGQKVILAKTVAEIHNVRLNDIQDLIINNLNEFDIGIDLLDLKNSTDSVGSLLELGFSNQSIANSINIYLLSEQGYIALVGLMRTDKAREIRKQFRREYFAMKEQIQKSVLPTNYIESLEALVKSEKDKQVLTKQIEQLKTKTKYLNDILQSPSLILVTQIAQDYGMSAIKFNRMLKDLKVQYKANEQWVLYSQYDTQDYVHSVTHRFKRTDGTPDSSLLTAWTPKGSVVFIPPVKTKRHTPINREGGNMRELTIANSMFMYSKGWFPTALGFKSNKVSWVAGLLDILDGRGIKIYNSKNQRKYIENIIRIGDSFYYTTDEGSNSNE